MSRFYDLMVCIRCHTHLDLVLDTAASVRANTDPENTIVTFAVDGGCSAFAAELTNAVGSDLIHVSGRRRGWGAGLWTLLAESITEFDRRFRFLHFQSIDYDTLYLAPGADKAVLDRINEPSIGLLGVHCKNNQHWYQVIDKQKKRLVEKLGPFPPNYVWGEGVQGGCMTLTRSCIEAMYDRRLLEPPLSEARKYTHVADDHLITLFTKMCNHTIVDVSSFAKCTWTAQGDPRGIEKKGILIFHPTKMSPHNKTRFADLRVRNYFRLLRGERIPLK